MISYILIFLSVVPDMYSVQADATAYFGSVLTNSTSGTEVFRFRIVIDLSRFNNDLTAILTVMNRNNLVDSIFKFSDRENTRTFRFNDGIVAASVSGMLPKEIRLLESRFVVLEDFVIYQQAPPPSLELPTTLDFDLSIIALGGGPDNTQSVNFGVGNVNLIPPPGEYCRHYDLYVYYYSSCSLPCLLSVIIIHI